MSVRTPSELAEAAKAAIDDAIAAKEGGNQPAAFLHVQNATVLANLAVTTSAPTPFTPGGYL